MYHLFAGADYEAHGGIDDWVGAFVTVDEAKASASDDWAQIATWDGARWTRILDGETTNTGYVAFKMRWQEPR